MQNDQWFAASFHMARKWLLRRKKLNAPVFVFEQLHEHLIESGLEPPKTEKSWGSLALQLKSEGLIAETGKFHKNVRASRRGGRSLEWRAV